MCAFANPAISPCCFPGAAQREAVRCRPGPSRARTETPKTPDQRCTTNVLHRVRGTRSERRVRGTQSLYSFAFAVSFAPTTSLRRSGNRLMSKVRAITPQTPEGANNISRIARPPRMIRYQEPSDDR
jgi:hypothetical protein